MSKYVNFIKENNKMSISFDDSDLPLFFEDDRRYGFIICDSNSDYRYKFVYQNGYVQGHRKSNCLSYLIRDLVEDGYRPISVNIVLKEYL